MPMGTAGAVVNEVSSVFVHRHVARSQEDAEIAEVRPPDAGRAECARGSLNRRSIAPTPQAAREPQRNGIVSWVSAQGR